jgi:ribosome-binding protein aMBF1 (putative translation factor)
MDLEIMRRFVRGRIVYAVSKTMTASDKKLDRLVADLGEAIRERRQGKNLSQEALAEIADFDRTYISLLERGERNPSFTNLCRVAAALGVTPSELLKGISYNA